VLEISNNAAEGIHFMSLLLNARRSALYVAGAVLALAANTERAAADVVGPGSLTSSASLSGNFGVGPHTSSTPFSIWDDQLFANPGVNDPGYQVIFSIVLSGTNTPASSGETTVNSRGVLDFVTFHNFISSETVVPDPTYSKTITLTMPLYQPGSPVDGILTNFRMQLQTIASFTNTSPVTGFTTASDFSAYLSSIRAVDAAGNDITQQIGLHTASGFMGISAAPEPGTFVLVIGGLLLLPLVRSDSRKKIASFLS
jgi:hypothetical protein